MCSGTAGVVWARAVGQCSEMAGGKGKERMGRERGREERGRKKGGDVYLQGRGKKLTFHRAVPSLSFEEIFLSQVQTEEGEGPGWESYLWASKNS